MNSFGLTKRMIRIKMTGEWESMGNWLTQLLKNGH